jgi:hypothetical protein
MRKYPDRDPFGEPSLPHDPLPGTGRLGDRPAVPPALSVALVVAVIVAVAGVGLGYRLGQVSIEGARATATPTVTPAAASFDLQPDAVSRRLELAVESAGPTGWVVCSVGTAVRCVPLKPIAGQFAAEEYGFRFTSAEWARLTPASIPTSHLVLAAELGEGTTTGLLMQLGRDEAPAQSYGMVPVDPGRAGVDYYDLGSLVPGRYAVAIGYLPLPNLGASLGTLRSYLAGFVSVG